MEIQQLKYFVTVAKELNFTRAAGICHVAQPSLSQQVQKLESELGGPLFHRMGRRILLTDLGEALLPRARRILQLHKETLHEASERSAGGGTVRFGAILTIAPYLFPPVSSAIKRGTKAPHTDAKEDFTENLLKDLRDGQLDFAIMAAPIEEPGLLSRVLKREPFLAVLPKGHDLLKQKEIALEDLLQDNFLPLSYIHCAGKQISELCAIGGGIRPTGIQCAQIETILRLVAQGSGVTILPKMALTTTHGRRLEFRPLKQRNAHRDIVLVQHQDRYLGSSARSMMTVVEKALQKME